MGTCPAEGKGCSGERAGLSRGWWGLPGGGEASPWMPGPGLEPERSKHKTQGGREGGTETALKGEEAEASLPAGPACDARQGLW